MGAGRALTLIRRPPPRLERAALILAAVAMLISVVWLLRDGRLDPSAVAPVPLAIAALVGVPLTLATNAAEFWVSAWFIDRRVSAVFALRTTILATAANLLPLPGGPLVRVHALHRRGVAVAIASAATAAVGLSWLGLAGLVAAAGAFRAGAASWVTVVSAAGGGVALGAGLLLVVQVAVPGRRLLGSAALLVTEALSLFAAAGRLWLVLLALGVDPSVPAVMVLAAAGVLATAVGIVPAGLGVREGLSALLATFVALPAATGFAVSLLDRLVGLFVAIPLSLLLSRSVASEVA